VTLKKAKTVVQTPNIIEVRDVVANYDGDDVISDINISVKQGEALGLIGLNGAGKTTIIKILLGLLEPRAGHVLLDGQSNASIATKNKIAYLPEKFEPPAFLNGLEFIRFALSLYNKTCNDARAFDAAKRFVLDPEALKHRVNTYSKGMRQKLGLISTFLTDCPIMILDEPMSGLDPKARTCVKDEILKYKKSGGSLFICSHILSDMEEICDRVNILHDGKLCFVGTPATLKTQTKQDYLERAFLKLIDKVK